MHRGTPHASWMSALGGILGPADGAVFAVLGDRSRGEDHGRAGFWGLDRLSTSRSRPGLQKGVVIVCWWCRNVGFGREMGRLRLA